MAGPLAGLRVIDLTQYVAGPYCTKLLALFGATVIKVERPRQGDPMRHIGPFAGNKPGPDRSLAFLDLNVNKLGITLKLASESGRCILHELIRHTDVVVESFQPGTIDSLGLSYEELKEIHPGIVLTSISDFGQTGPYRNLPASEIVLYAMGHEMYGTGQPDAEPLSMAPRLNLYFAGETAAVGTMGAVLGQQLYGQGDWVDVSIMESLMSSIDRRADSLIAYAYCGEKKMREATMPGLAMLPWYNVCKDGYFHITVGSSVSWQRLVQGLQEPWLNDPKYEPPVSDPVLIEEFKAFWIPWCMQRTKGEITNLFQKAGLTCVPVNSIADLLDDPHLMVRGYFQVLAHPVVGTARYTGLPFVAHSTPGELKQAAPTLGRDNETILGELGYSREDIIRLASLGVI